MDLQAVKTISVLGAGLMGHGIAQSFIMGGYHVVLYDIEESILEKARAQVESNLELFHLAKLTKSREMESCLRRLVTTTDLKQAVERSDFITEAVPEILELKQEIFERVESLSRENAILATNTSSLTLTDICVRVKKRGRTIVTHWFNPPHIVPTVEVVKGEETTEETLEMTCQLLAKIKKIPVKIRKELPGFLVNRIQMAMMREVFDLYERGVATAQDIDEAIRGSIGIRLAVVGPLLTVDLAGIDTWVKSSKNLLPQIQSSTEPPKILFDLASQGHYGVKSGKGFYEYDKNSTAEVIKKRDRELLKILKNHYQGRKTRM